MKFPWNKYEELETKKRNTLQVFITNRCNLKCDGCFARNAMNGDNKDISIEEYHKVISDFIDKGGEKINLLGGEPLLHPKIKKILSLNKLRKLKTTIYTNGLLIDKYREEDFCGAKIRLSVYNVYEGMYKSILNLPIVDYKVDFCYMVSKETKVIELLTAVQYINEHYNCDTFFISSIRELDNDRKEFFDDTDMTMPLIEYKELVHTFLEKYSWQENIDMNIHISKRGVFESAKNLPVHKCKFANLFIGGKIIQCPYDIVNLKYQEDYEFDKRNCQHNSSCLMSKIIVKKKRG